jgi:protein-disulfide isomerase
MKQKTLFILSLTLLLLAFIVGAVIYSSQKYRVNQQQTLANQEALIRMHSPSLGNQDATVVIVEFFDPACETCAAFYPRVKELMSANPGRIRLVLRYAPFHNGSDKVVAMLEGARRQGKFWPALESLLASQAEWSPHHTPQPALAWKRLEALGLNSEQLMVDMTRPEIANLIAQDLADARSLSVTMTPEYFVNGRPLPSFGFEQLTQLVKDELQKTRK